MTAAVDARRVRRGESRPEGTVIGIGLHGKAVAEEAPAPKRRPETAPLDAREIMKKGLLKDIAKELKAWTGQVFSIKEAAAKIAFLKTSLINHYNNTYGKPPEKGDSVIEVPGQKVLIQLKVGEEFQETEIFLVQARRSGRLDIVGFPLENWQKITEAMTLSVDIE